MRIQQDGFIIEMRADGVYFRCMPGRGIIITGATFQSVPIEAINPGKDTASRPGKYLCPAMLVGCETLLPSEFQHKGSIELLKKSQREHDTDLKDKI